jgi:hypothetical protein
MARISIKFCALPFPLRGWLNIHITYISNGARHHYGAATVLSGMASAIVVTL